MALAKTLKMSFAAIAVGGAALAAAVPAQAGADTGTWRNGMVAGPYGPGYYGPHGHAYGPHRHHGWDRGWRGGDCRIIRRRFVNRWGDVVIRRQEVCD